MSDELSKKMKQIVVEEDRSGYVIDKVGLVEGEEADNEEREEKKPEAETSAKKAKKVKKKKDKSVEKGDSGEEDADVPQVKMEGRPTLVSFRQEDEKLNKREEKNNDEGETSTDVPDDAQKEDAPMTDEEIAMMDLNRRTYQSFHSPYKRLSLVADTSDLKNKLQDAGSNLVVIDFFATWCGPCKMISPKVEELAKEYPDVIFLKVDIDECDEIATEYDVQSMPTFIFIKNSAKIDGFSGANYDKLKETVQKLK